MSPRVLYSVRLNRLKAGEQLVVDARAHVGIGNLPYNTLIRSQLLLTEGPGAVDHKGLPGLVQEQRRSGRVQRLQLHLRGQRLPYPVPDPQGRGGEDDP